MNTAHGSVPPGYRPVVVLHDSTDDIKYVIAWMDATHHKAFPAGLAREIGVAMIADSNTVQFTAWLNQANAYFAATAAV